MSAIHAVARLAGVSAKTVSRVLNGEGQAAPRMRETVQGAIGLLDYVPSNAARTTRSNRFGFIGVITGAITAAQEATRPVGLPYLRIIQGIQHALAEREMMFMIADTGGRADRVRPLVHACLEHRAEGLIYVADHHQRVEIPQIERPMPLVLASCFEETGTTAILPDDRRGQFDLVERLAAKGHRPAQGHGCHAPPTQGYREALEQAGIHFDPAFLPVRYLADGEGETQHLYDALDGLLRLAGPPTVLCCGNDAMALRMDMRAEIGRLDQQLGATTIYITHDQVEAMTLADTIVFLKDGQVMQAVFLWVSTTTPPTCSSRASSARP